MLLPYPVHPAIPGQCPPPLPCQPFSISDSPPPVLRRECVALQDPYCAWHLHRKRCVPIDHQRFAVPELVQNVREGVSRHCPEGEYGKPARSGRQSYTAETRGSSQDRDGLN